MRTTAIVNVGGAVTAAVAFAFLQIALALFYWLPEPRAATFVAPTWELLIVSAILLGWAAARDELVAERWPSSWVGLRRAAIDRWSVVAIAAVLAVYVLLGFAQGFARREFGYDLQLAFHIHYVPSLFRMMYDAESLPRFVLYVVILVAGTGLAIFAVYMSVRRLHRLASERRGRIAFAAAAAAFAVATLPTVGTSGSLTSEAYAQLDLALNLEEKLDREARELEVGVATLRRLNPFGRMESPPSIYVFVIESYGAAVFAGAPVFDATRAQLRAHADALAADGFHIRSRLLDAPVFGGSSWMANASIMCGEPLRDQKRYEGLFASSARCLPEWFNRAGYRTVIGAGNTTRLEDRYARVFPFDHYVFKGDFDYRGPRFGWGFVPDQFAIDFVDDHILDGHRDRPTLAYYQLTSSHHTWKHVPPYVEDWDAIDLHGEIYRGLRGARFDNRFIGGSQYAEAYARSIEYVMRAVVTYAKTLPDDALVIVLGDHQPRRPIADMNDDPWLVPVHVLGRDPAAIARFAGYGYEPGIEPPPLATIEASPPGTWDLFRHVFGAYAGAARAH